jgi:hypothetical protein
MPTLQSTTNYLERWYLPGVVGAGVMLSFPDGGIEVGPGQGLCVVTPAAVAFPASDFTFCWDE